MLGLGISKRHDRSAGESALSALDTAPIILIVRVTAEPVSLDEAATALTRHGEQHALVNASSRPALGNGLALGIETHCVWTISM